MNQHLYNNSCSLVDLGSLIEEERKAIAQLYRAVVIQAVIDATVSTYYYDGISPRGKQNLIMNRKIKLAAKQWFNLNNQDFMVICELARLDPARVFRITRKLISDHNQKQKTMHQYRMRRFMLEGMIAKSDLDTNPEAQNIKHQKPTKARIAKVLLFPDVNLK